jgi:acyl CoA:acetate/3-ketoacid CoA transferase alpha subunit
MLSEHGYHEGITLNDGRYLVVGGFGPLGNPSAETYDVDGHD